MALDEVLSKVATVYSSQPEREWQRLEQDAYHQLEYRLTLHYLQRYLPTACRILDAGGGPGRYAITLCQAGHKVTLLDAAPGHIALAQTRIAAEPVEVRQRLSDARVGDIRQLPFTDTTFDATLCLGGPLSHLPDEEDRVQAVRELVRVTKPGGLVLLTGIGYLAVLRTILCEFSHELIDGSLATMRDDGNSGGPGGMRWHWFRAEELRALAEAQGLHTLTMVGCQGLSAGLIEATNALAQDDVRWQAWMEWVLATAEEPGVVAMSEHLLYIGCRKTEEAVTS